MSAGVSLAPDRSGTHGWRDSTAMCISRFATLMMVRHGSSSRPELFGYCEHRKDQPEAVTTAPRLTGRRAGCGVAPLSGSQRSILGVQ